MHDFLLAKEIVDEVLGIVKEKGFSKISKVYVEIGQISLSHDGHEDHVEDISIENLEFGLKSVARGTLLENTRFDIRKITGDHWSIASIDAE